MNAIQCGKRVRPSLTSSPCLYEETTSPLSANKITDLFETFFEVNLFAWKLS